MAPRKNKARKKKQNTKKSANEQDQRIRKLIHENYGDGDEHCLEEDVIGDYKRCLEEDNIVNASDQRIGQQITEIYSDEDEYCLEEDNNYEEASANHPKILNLANIIHRAQLSKTDHSYKAFLDNDNMSNNVIDDSYKTFLDNNDMSNTVQISQYLKINIYSESTVVKIIINFREESLDSELSEFVNVGVLRQILQLHLKCTDMVEVMKDPEIFMRLVSFVRQALKAVLFADHNNQSTIAAIRGCDEYTIDLKIPTRLGIVKSLPVRELLSL
ncbi:17197_t:CDS:2 [Racocetra fulgida]|uniref:17197_t:CDS:1 n=1 Tax=Racocetra fulgida TaxID=60492 RepID=A0A9N9F0M5_9GLOM|nr:17197_t:CDS:2 [Racocetra fulgida]